MNKHTPGKWKADEENCGDGLNIISEDGRRIGFTATVRNPDYTPVITEEAQANARLMAKSPELFEALTQLENAATAAHVIIQNVRPDGQIAHDLSAAIDFARYVLKSLP